MKERVLAPGKERLRNLAGKTLGHMHRYLSAPSIKRKKKKKREKNVMMFTKILFVYHLDVKVQFTCLIAHLPYHSYKNGYITHHSL